jgi:hypothetical protein
MFFGAHASDETYETYVEGVFRDVDAEEVLVGWLGIGHGSVGRVVLWATGSCLDLVSVTGLFAESGEDRHAI